MFDTRHLLRMKHVQAYRESMNSRWSSDCNQPIASHRKDLGRGEIYQDHVKAQLKSAFVSTKGFATGNCYLSGKQGTHICEKLQRLKMKNIKNKILVVTRLAEALKTERQHPCMLMSTVMPCEEQI